MRMHPIGRLRCVRDRGLRGLDEVRSTALGAAHGLTTLSPDELLSSPEIDIVLNLTPLPHIAT